MPDRLTIVTLTMRGRYPDGRLIVGDAINADFEHCGERPVAVHVEYLPQLHFARAVNAAFSRVPEGDVLFLDDDTRAAEPDFLSKLQSYRDRYDLFCGYNVAPDDSAQWGWAPGYDPANGVVYEPYPPKDAADRMTNRPTVHANFLDIYITRHAIEELRGMIIDPVLDEGLYCEDIDLSLRAWQAGLRVGVAPVKFIHLGGWGVYRGTEKNLWDRIHLNRRLTDEKWAHHYPLCAWPPERANLEKLRG